MHHPTDEQPLTPPQPANPKKNEPANPAACKAFGERVRTLRKAAGWTQHELSEKCGSLHRTYLGQLERGQRNPSLGAILTIAEAFSIDAGVLLRGMNLDDPHAE